mgnify:CR=1 FL=1
MVDFSLTFFFSETSFLVAKDSPIKTKQDLNGKRLGGARGPFSLVFRAIFAVRMRPIPLGRRLSSTIASVRQHLKYGKLLLEC